MVSSRIAPTETSENMVASIEGGAGDNKTAATTVEKKRQSGSGRAKKRSHSSQANDAHHGEGGNIAQSNAATASSAGLATSGSEGRDRKHHRRRHRHRHGSKGATGAKDNKHNTHGADTVSDTEAGGQEDKLKLLVECIPYVGLGDATRDNMVRTSTWFFIFIHYPITLKLEYGATTVDRCFLGSNVRSRELMIAFVGSVLDTTNKRAKCISPVGTTKNTQRESLNP